MEPMFYLDEPSLNGTPSDGVTFRIRGWIAGSEPISQIRLEAPSSYSRPLPTVDCSDYPLVREVLGLKSLDYTVHILAECEYSRVADLDGVEIVFQYNGQTHRFLAPVYAGPVQHMGNKKDKLAGLLPHLRCPHCFESSFDQRESALVCGHCSAHFAKTEQYIDFLSDQLREECNIVDTDNVSSNAYDGQIIDIINRNHKGLVLDCGAGSKEAPNYFDNVVNYEIVAYPSTDVLGVGQSLPFQDATFDAVISCAVLEHVQDPFLCAKELQRVLKPGGTLYCQVPFLQPLHGYPHHYYNMTQMGMRNLFEEQMDIHKVEVMDQGQPYHTLLWILSSYAAGLPEHLREDFLNRPVKDFMRPTGELIADKFTTALSAQAREEMACSNYMVATKKQQA